MTLTLYANTSEANRLVKDISEIATYSGTLREAASILDPVITIETDSNTLFTANYAYIPDFGRYYYIEEITAVNNKLYQIRLHVDVLMTYAEKIKEQTAIIQRQENRYNLYLNDPMFKTYQNPIIVTKAFPNKFDAISCILLVAGGWGFE